MSFVYPAFLFASALVAIPIIVHLFNFRRYKTVYFTNVRFLKEVKEETTSRSKLKHLLVLAARVLAVLFLVFAFAQPFIPVSKNDLPKDGNRGISIFIDNSFSMSAEADDEALLLKAKRKAGEIVDVYGETGRFQLLTNDFEARHQRFVSREEVLNLIDEVQPTPRSRPLREVLAMQKKTYADARMENNVAYWLSDFQKNIADFEPDTAINLSLAPLQSVKQQNVYVDSAWFERPVIFTNQPNNLFVKIVNSGDGEVENNRLTLNINGQTKAINDYSIAANSFTIDTLAFIVPQDGWYRAELSIQDYPITFDDNYYMAFRSTEKVPVLVISEEQEGPFLKAIYADSERFGLTNQAINKLDYTALNQNGLIVLNNLSTIPSGLAAELVKYLQNGGALVVFPSAKADINSFNNFFGAVGVNKIAGLSTAEMPVTALETNHELFKDVFESVPRNLSLPNTRLHYTFTPTTRSNEQELLTFRDGSSFMSAYDYDGGKLYIAASPLDRDITDFPVHAIFVPMLYKMALSGGQLQAPAYTLGNDNVVEVIAEVVNPDESLKLKGNNAEFIPQQRINGNRILLTVNDQSLRDAGIFEVQDKDVKVLAVTAFNYNRSESVAEYYTLDELKNRYPENTVAVLDASSSDFAGLVQEFDRGIVLWKLCIIFVLLFAGIEALLLRFMK
jgi:hypothetical protein